MNEHRRLPIHKRWPNRYAVRATIYTPAGGRINIETDLDDIDGEAVTALLIQAAVAEVEEEIEETE